MNGRQFPIRRQILLGFSLLLLLWGALGALALVRARQIRDSAERLHAHPLQVREAARQLQVAVLSIRQKHRDLLLETNHESRAELQKTIETDERDMEQALSVLTRRYLGPSSDIERVRRLIGEWSTARVHTLDLVSAGQTSEAISRMLPHGAAGRKGEELLEAIGIVDAFAKRKAGALLEAARETNRALMFQMLVFAVIVVSLSVLVIFLIIRNFHRSLDGVLRATKTFSDDDPSHAPVPPNEFGELALAYNALVDRVSSELRRQRALAVVNRHFIETAEPTESCDALLATLMNATGATTGALLLPDDTGALLVPFVTAGLDPRALKPVPIDTSIGECGLALRAGGFLHLTGFPEAGPHVLPCTPGLVFPQELCTLVPQLGDQIVALISLGTNRRFDPWQTELVRALLEPIATGLSALITQERLRKTSLKLASSNDELMRQQEELRSQAQELGAQNREIVAQNREIAAQNRELAALNRELELQKMQLGEMNRVKSAFFSNMSHELRTPLNSVIALSGVLTRRLSGKISEEEAGYLDVIDRNGRQLLALINDVLDLARLEAGRDELHLEEVHVPELIQDVCLLLAPLARQKGLELVVEAREDTPPAFTDPVKVRQILQNLVGNALKFTRNGSVTVRQRVEGDRLSVAVIDTGIGIPEDQLDLVFEEFRQATGSLSGGQGGTGLGLAIARRHAGLLGGSLQVQSRVGQGSTFTFEFPLRPGHAVGGPAADEVSGPAGAGGNGLLLIEDNEAAVIQIRDLLPADEYRLRVAHDGESGLAAIREETPDGIILDLNMPGIDGFEVLRCLREEPATAHTPVLILTARHVSRDELSFLRENRIYQLIQKGAIQRDDLLARVRNMLGLPAEPS